MMSFSVFCVCPFVSHRFGIICAFVSNANAQDGVNALPTALRHTTEDTATYFNHTRKVQFLSSCHRSKLIWHPFNLSYLFSSTFYSPQEYVTLLTTNYRELEAAIAKALDGKIQK
jgi:hypothetical protein